MKKIMLIAVCLLAVNMLFAQKNHPDCSFFLSRIESSDSLLRAGTFSSADSLLDQISREEGIYNCPLAEARWFFVKAFAKDLKGHWPDAVLDYQLALHKFEELVDSNRVHWKALVHRHLAIVKGKQGEYYNQVKYAEQSVELFGQIGDMYNRFTSAITLANGYHYIGQDSLTEATLLAAKKFFRSEGDGAKVGITAYNLADLFYHQDNVGKAEKQLEEAIENYRKVNNIPGLARGYNLAGALHYFQKDYDLATTHFDTSFYFAEMVNEVQLQLDALVNLSKVAVVRSDIETARMFYDQAKQAFERSGKNILDRTYLDLMEKSILALEETRRKYLFQMMSGVLVFLVAVLFGLIYLIKERNKRKQLENNRRAFQVKIEHELENAKRIKEIAELNKKNLEEEKRAGELEKKLRQNQENAILEQAKAQKEAIEKLNYRVHNEIAGRLWLVFKDINKAIACAENGQLDLTVLMQIATDIDKVKEIARNVDRSLEEQDFNWLELITDLFQDIKRVIDCPKVSFSTHGLNHKFPLEMPLGLGTDIYQIVNNCVYNALKHAKAKNVDCQINIVKNELNVIVEDDGCGFESVDNHEGAGFKIIRNLVDNASGTLSIDSGEKGTIIIAAIPLIA